MTRTITLLLFSNIFMTFAWYGNLKHAGMPLWKAIAISWGIAFFEYCLMVPANRFGYANGVNGFQLKMLQEVITLLVFSVFAVIYLKEPFHPKYLVSFALLLGQFILCLKSSASFLSGVVDFILFRNQPSNSSAPTGKEN